MPLFPENNLGDVYDIVDIELDKDHPLYTHLIIAAVGNHDFMADAPISARAGGSFRDLTTPWGFQGLLPYSDPANVGTFVSIRNDTFMRNLYREWTIISGTISMGNETSGGGAFFGIGSSPTSTFDYAIQGMMLGTNANTALETVQKYHNGVSFTFQIYRSTTGIYDVGTPSAPVANVYAVTHSYDTGLNIGGTTLNRPVVFYKNGTRVSSASGDPGTTGSCFINLLQTSASPTYMSATESNTGTVNQRQYGYFGFTYVFNRYLDENAIARLSANPMLVMTQRYNLPFSINKFEVTPHGDIDVDPISFAGTGSFTSTATLDIGMSISPVEVETNIVTELDGLVLQDFVPNTIDAPTVTFTGAGALTASDPSYEYTLAGFTENGVGAFTVVVPLVERAGTDYTIPAFSWDGVGAYVVTTDPTVVHPLTGSDITVEDIAFRSRGAFLLGSPFLIRVEKIRLLQITPDDTLRAEFEQPIVSVWRVVDILNPDETVFMDDVGAIEGSVSVDLGRGERRSLDMTFDNYDRSMSPQPGGFWYDKIIRVRRGVELLSATRYEFDLGYFMIDSMKGDQQHTTVKITGRDYTKKMLSAKYGYPVNYNVDDKVRDLITRVANFAGIPTNKIVMPLDFTDKLTAVVTFDGDQSMWDISKKLIEPYNMDMFFDRNGVLTIRPQVDPLTTAAVARFGVSEANMVTLERSTNDSELFNSVTVVQDSSANRVSATGGAVVVPPFYTAENHEPSSPTRIEAIGLRSKRITSPVIDTVAQAQAMATQFLKIAALEQYELQMETLNYPWLDVGNVVVVIDPEASAVDPENYLLTNLDISVQLGAMSAKAKRITVVG